MDNNTNLFYKIKLTIKFIIGLYLNEKKINSFYTSKLSFEVIIDLICTN